MGSGMESGSLPEHPSNPEVQPRKIHDTCIGILRQLQAQVAEELPHPRILTGRADKWRALACALKGGLKVLAFSLRLRFFRFCYEAAMFRFEKRNQRSNTPCIVVDQVP